MEPGGSVQLSFIIRCANPVDEDQTLSNGRIFATSPSLIPAHPDLALGARLIELAEANGHVAADDDRPPSRLENNHLQPARVARRRDEPKPGQQLELAVDRLVAQAGRLHPVADRVILPSPIRPLTPTDTRLQDR
jgi:hypothetical protein